MGGFSIQPTDLSIRLDKTTPVSRLPKIEAGSEAEILTAAILEGPTCSYKAITE